MVKFEEAQARIFKNVFVCRKCKSKQKAPSMKISLGLISCRNCKSKAFRPKKRK